MKPRTKFQQNVVAASKTPAAAYPRTNRMGVQELHRAYRTPHAERTYHLHRVRPHVAERKRRTHGQVCLGCECPHCHTTLKVETTLRRKFNDYEYLCIVTRCKGFKSCASSISSVGRKWDRRPFTPISKPYSGGLPPTDAPQPSHGCARWASSFTGGVGRAHWNCGRRTTGNTTSRPHASIPGNGLSPNCAEAVTANNSPM